MVCLDKSCTLLTAIVYSVPLRFCLAVVRVTVLPLTATPVTARAGVMA